jgi:DNA-binding HxlR family transcriptional regulator
MALLDLLGRRWTMRLLWELRSDSMGFRELQRRCDQMSSSMLNTRLNELAAAGFADNNDGVWRLTATGRELLVVVRPLTRFADEWAANGGWRPD